MNQLIEQLQQLGSPRVAVLGDLMLDRYVFGDAERLSPEAPVPVLKAVRQEERLGGAANVVGAVVALGGRAMALGLRGEDAGGEALSAMLQALPAEIAGLRTTSARPTIVKSRYVGLAQHRHAQQMLRVDDESTAPLTPEEREVLQDAVEHALGSADVLALEDYDKGLLNDEDTPRWIARAREMGKPVVVDPARLDCYDRYRGATLLTPNRYEAELLSGIRVDSPRSMEQAAEAVLHAADADAVAITLDREGMYVKRRGQTGRQIPTRPRSVYDVTGAGDVVMAAFCVAVAGGLSFEDAAALANVAGGLEVERFGVVPVTRREMIDDMRRTLGQRGSKVLDRSQLAAELERRKSRGEKIVFTNGCFDLLHVGHVSYLQQARDEGSCLVVAINTDQSIRRLKGSSRPIIPQQERAELLAALECVDYVTLFDEDTPEELLRLLQPDVLVKGGSTDVIVGREIVEHHGGRVARLDLVEGRSTTSIVDDILRQHNGK